VQLHQKYNKKGVHIIGLSDESDSKVSAYLEKHKTPYYIASGSKSARAYGIKGFPTFYVINPAGKITYVGHDVDEAKEAIEECLEKTPPKSAEEVAKEHEAAAIKALKKADSLYEKENLSDALDAYDAVAFEYADTESGKTAKAQAKKVKLELAEFTAAAELKKADGLVTRKKYPQAMTAYEAIVKDYGKTASGRKAATKLEKLRGDKNIATEMREAEAARKCNGWLQMARGMVKNGKPDSARKYYQKIIEEYGDTSFARIAKEEMKGL